MRHIQYKGETLPPSTSISVCLGIESGVRRSNRLRAASQVSRILQCFAIVGFLLTQFFCVMLYGLTFRMLYTNGAGPFGYCMGFSPLFPFPPSPRSLLVTISLKNEKKKGVRAVFELVIFSLLKGVCSACEMVQFELVIFSLLALGVSSLKRSAPRV